MAQRASCKATADFLNLADLRQSHRIAVTVANLVEQAGNSLLLSSTNPYAIRNFKRCETVTRPANRDFVGIEVGGAILPADPGHVLKLPR